MAPMAEPDCCRSGRRRFAVACSVLNRCVRAEAAAAGRVAAAAAPHGRSEAASSTMLLMPGADVDAAREEAAAAPPAAPAQLTIMYGGRVLVFDDVPAGWAAEVMMRAAARQDVPAAGPDDLQVARKASLQRLMQKRRDRIAARAPYATAHRVVVAPKEGRDDGDAGSWLGLVSHEDARVTWRACERVVSTLDVAVD